MNDRLAAPLKAAGHPPDSLVARHIALIRYAGQSDTVEVPFTPPLDPEVLGTEFKTIHERLYGFATDEPWELDTLRLTLSAPAKNDITAMKAVEETTSTTPIATADCWFDAAGPATTPRYARGALPADWRVAGPAIIEDECSTVVVPPDATVWADSAGQIHIDTGQGS